MSYDLPETNDEMTAEELIDWCLKRYDWPELQEAASWLEENSEGAEVVADAIIAGDDPVEALDIFYAETGIDREVSFT
jgi:hypothetical protein